MNELASAEFRKQYGKLVEVTAVTVNGHLIGTWTPIDPRPFLQTKETPSGNYVGATRFPGGGIQARQAQRDELLRKINRGK